MSKPDTAIDVPQQVSGIDLRDLPIGPEEAFVWSRVDGSRSNSQICHATGLPQEVVDNAICRLSELGAISFSSNVDGSCRSGSVSSPISSPNSSSPLGSSPRQLSEMVVAIDQEDFYELLSVARSATKSEIKAAYFELVNVFHPDKFFGQIDTQEKAQLEKVFMALTDAHDTLTRSAKRRAYDAELPPTASSSHADTKQRKPLAPSSRQKVDSVIESSPQPSSSRREHNVSVITRSASGTGSGSPQVPPAPGSSLKTHEVRPSIDGQASGERLASLPETMRSKVRPTTTDHKPSHVSDATRAAAARRLMGSLRPSARRRSAPGTTLETTPVSTPSYPGINLRGFEPPSSSRRHLIAADRAEANGDLVAACNYIRLALNLNPRDPQLAERLKRLEAEADVHLADEYLTRAKQNAQLGEWGQAAELYARAGRGKADATLHHKAAECSLRADTGLRQTTEHIKAAIALEPENPDLHLFLAQIYAQAGMRSSALTELNKAQQLNPEDDTIKDWLTRVKRGDF